MGWVRLPPPAQQRSESGDDETTEPGQLRLQLTAVLKTSVQVQARAGVRVGCSGGPSTVFLKARTQLQRVEPRVCLVSTFSADRKCQNGCLTLPVQETWLEKA